MVITFVDIAICADGRACMCIVDTAFIASRGGWLLCDDSSVKSVDPRQVVVGANSSFLSPLDLSANLTLQSQRAYVLFYKRTRA